MLESQIRTPALVVDLDALEKNMKTMREFTETIGVALRPHYKSHKCTAIAHMQMANGAKGLCCAKPGEAEDLAAAGIEDILIANQITDPGKIAQIAALAGCCRLTVCVDHAENLNALSAAAALQNSTIHCLVEYDLGMNRCGVRSHGEVHALARLARDAPNLVFEGVQAYAGQIAHEENFAARKAYSEKIEDDLTALKKYLEEKGLPPKEISGVSTGTTFMRPKGSVYTEIQAGSYIFMDSAYNALTLPFKNSISVLTAIISINNGSIIGDAGLKTVSTDQKPPVVREYPDAPVNWSEEHCSFPAPSPKHAINDRLHVIPSHCCTTVNLHDSLYFVRKGMVVDKVPVTSRGKSW